MESPGDMTLWYDILLIGQVTDVHYSDWTWWGILKKVARSTDGELAHRLLSFVDFCADWNERTKENPANPPSAAEFDQYTDLLNSGLWYVVTSQGVQQRIDTAPLFHAGGDFSWRVKKE